MRDVYDLAVLLTCDRAAAERHTRTLLAKRAVLHQRVEQFTRSRERFYDQLNVLATTSRFAVVKDTALEIVCEFVRP